MTSRRLTPHAKDPSSASKFRTPKNLNTTVMGRSGTGPKTKASSSKKTLASQSSLDLATSILSDCPSILPSLGVSRLPEVDYELECDFAYSEYLQSLLRRDIVSNIAKTHIQEMKDQLSVQKDILYKTERKLHQITQQVVEMDTLSEADEVLNNLQTESAVNFVKTCKSDDLEGTVKNIITMLQSACKKLLVKNVKSIDSQQDYAKLGMQLQKCASMCKEMQASDAKIVNDLGVQLRDFQDKLDAAYKNQKLLNDLQTYETSKLLKFLSDLYVEKEKYDH